jgi:galactokinase
MASDMIAARYGPGPVAIFHAPGRVNLIGEHTDYNHGYVMPMALDKDVLIIARPRQDQTVRLANTEPAFSNRQFRIAQKIPSQPIGDWANYAQGPAQLLEQERGPGLRGYDALVDGATPYGVPRGAGLSSSSALTVAHAVTLVGLNGIQLDGPALAEACGRAEWYVGTRGGIMDQFISILARRDHALFLDCRPTPSAPGGYAMRHVPIPSGYAVVVADSTIRHRNTGPHYNRRVAEGRIGVRLLQRRYSGITHLRDVEGVPWADLEPLLPEVIHSAELRAQGIDPDSILDRGVSAQTDTFTVRRRCRHVITENQRVLQIIKALEGGQVSVFGQLMNEAHASARDDYEISTPEIEVLVRLANAFPATVGARLTGAGWGGCIVALVEQDGIEEFGHQLTQGYKHETGLDTQVTICRSAAGAGQVFETRVS